MFNFFNSWIDNLKRNTGKYFERPNLKVFLLRNIFGKLFVILSINAEAIFLVTLVALFIFRVTSF